MQDMQKSTTEVFVIALHKAVFAMDRSVDRLLAERFDLTFSQFFILRVLAKRSGTTQKAIAGARGLTEAAVSRSIDVLLEKKLVTRKVNPTNRREHMLVLTKEGAKLEFRARRAALGKINGALKEFTDSERKILVRAAEKLHVAFAPESDPLCE